MLTPEKILTDLIRVNTVNPPGNETAAALYLKGIFDAAGIPNEIVEPEKGRGSFFARLGSGSKKLLYLSHTDVVPAGDDWDYDPFSGDIRDGFVLGRGARDCKSLVAAEAYAMLKLAAEGVSLNGTLIFGATADEERAGHHGVRHILDHCPEKLQADFVINEGAEEPVEINGRMLNFIQVGEKGTAWCRLTTRGKSCHGSIPTLGANAVAKMARIITAISNHRPEIRLVPEVRVLLEEIGRLTGFTSPLQENNVDLLLESVKEKSFAEALRSMSRMTLSPNMVTGGSMTNVVPDFCQADVDIRILPGQDKEFVYNEISKLAGPNVEIELPNYYPSTISTSQCEFYELIEKATFEVAGRDISCLPMLSPWATDSRFLRDAGIPSYGIGLMAKEFDPQGRTTVHGRNENIDVASLRLKADFLVTLARNYLT